MDREFWLVKWTYAVPESVVNGLVAEEIHSSASTTLRRVQTHSEMPLNEFHSRKIRLGWRSTTVQEDGLSTECLETEADSGACFSQSTSDGEIRVRFQETDVLWWSGFKLGAAIPADSESCRWHCTALSLFDKFRQFKFIFLGIISKHSILKLSL